MCSSDLAGPVHLPTPLGVRRVDVQSALQMQAAVQAEVGAATIFIAAAAVADWRPASSAEHKIKKDGSGKTPELQFVENTDILATVAQSARARGGELFCVGFAAESRNLDEYAEGKRKAKKLPLIVGNLVQDGLGGDDNEVVLFDAAGRHPLPKAPKPEVARAIVAHLAALLPKI